MGTLSPSRDDRGVFVTLRGLFHDGRGGGGLTPAGEAQLAELGRIAAAHPAFPVEVVLHDDRPTPPKDEAARKARAEVVAKAIAGAAAGARIEPIMAGNAAPVVDPSGADRARNARVEIVFVTPETF
jgi:outer membrane protein OmpA-like peptidoglycan-associated protein